MDPRGTSNPVEDPRGQCQELAHRAGVEIPHIEKARDYTSRAVTKMRDALRAEHPPANLSICVFGSWAREELTEKSDDDWAVLVPEPFATYDHDVLRAMELAQRYLGVNDRRPGEQGVFGEPFDVHTLEHNIGLDADTNTNLTRRMLLLLESCALTGETRDDGWRRILDRYLRGPSPIAPSPSCPAKPEYGLKPYHPPRFLLNDLTRYWRTICVDFEGKHRDTQGNDPKWVTRNAKLRTSRKLLFAGGLVPVLLCSLLDTVQVDAFLTSWLQAPPLDRIAAAFLWAGSEPEGGRTLAAYDRWLAIQWNSEKRAALGALRRDTRHDSPLFHEIKEIGELFERGLLALLFESPLAGLSRRFVVF